MLRQSTPDMIYSDYLLLSAWWDTHKMFWNDNLSFTLISRERSWYWWEEIVNEKVKTRKERIFPVSHKLDSSLHIFILLFIFFSSLSLRRSHKILLRQETTSIFCFSSFNSKNRFFSVLEKLRWRDGICTSSSARLSWLHYRNFWIHFTTKNQMEFSRS